MIREDRAHGLLGHPSNGHPPFAPVEKIFRILNRRQGRVVEERSFARCFRFDWLLAKGLQKMGLNTLRFSSVCSCRKNLQNFEQEARENCGIGGAARFPFRLNHHSKIQVK